MRWHPAVCCPECYSKIYQNESLLELEEIYAPMLRCCYCGKENRNNVYIREDADKLKCHHAKQD